jgi:hypothetical protein
MAFRKSMFNGPSGPLDTHTIISRSDFIEMYPLFLIQILSAPDDMLSSSRRDEPGVDICFKNLSLAVKVADKSINVVDHVTGRVQAKTMTALMGGSGAGELHNSLSIMHVFKTQLLVILFRENLASERIMRQGILRGSSRGNAYQWTAQRHRRDQRKCWLCATG